MATSESCIIMTFLAPFSPWSTHTNAAVVPVLDQNIGMCRVIHYLTLPCLSFACRPSIHLLHLRAHSVPRFLFNYSSGRFSFVSFVKRWD
ncbi:hypothetical protein EDD17DRAFT_1125950 [Pisolithus thermaeus]|nr:hypothetical protein EV401DRAFT_826185 [Pisolithus croceorrhizus]KAI6152764.1 hypothetical protein EDD17DRAFT_1125950 [Pisolithus thermaeus]